MQFIDNLVSSIKENSPEILVGFGIGGVIAGTVLACVETRKIDDILENHKETMEQIHMSADTGIIVDEETSTGVPYTEKDRRRDTALTYGKTALELAKIYLPSGIIIAGSICCIMKSHHILSTRNIGLTAAYTSLSSMFEDYRKNIIEKYGEDADAEARYSIKAKKVKTKDGEEVAYQETEKTGINEKDHSRFFDAASDQWDKSINVNLMRIYSAQKQLNIRLLKNRDHKVSLNECYQMLDLMPADDGRVIGYEYRPGIDPLDEERLPQVINIAIYVLNKNGKKILKSVNDIIRSGEEAHDSVMLLDFPNLVSIV